MTQRIAFLASVVLLGCIVAWICRGDAAPTPEQLATQALTANSLDERTRAAVRLADYGSPALMPLRHVLAESADPEVKAVCMQGLAELWDYESMEQFLSQAESGPPKVRGQAAQVVMRMTGRHRPYSSSAPAYERRLIVKYMRDDWATILEASSADREELKRRLRDSHD